MIRVQAEPFDPGAELNAFLARNPRSGGVASFVGQMRDFRGADARTGVPVAAMTLEHYAGMAERQLAGIVQAARSRWPLDDALVVHRHGAFAAGDPIVFVATAAAHRAEAFAACEFLMDWLKTEAPFWKKEIGPSGAGAWVGAEDADDARAERWRKDPSK